MMKNKIYQDQLRPDIHCDNYQVTILKQIIVTVVYFESIK